MLSDVEKTNLLGDFLLKLGSNGYSDDSLTEIASEELKKIYSDGFRHSYSYISSKVSDINKNDGIDYLSMNIQTLDKTVCEREDLQGVRKSVFKLCDHVNLEIARLSQMNTLSDKYEDLGVKLTKSKNQLNDIVQQNSQVKQSINKANVYIKKAYSGADKIKVELITILSIFSAIILAFMGGLSFSASVLESLYQSSIYKVIAVVAVLGLVLFNTIFGLLYVVSKIVDKNIYAKCNSALCTCKNKKGKTPKCWWINRLRKRLPYSFWVNVVLLVLLLGDIIVWRLLKYPLLY